MKFVSRVSEMSWTCCQWPITDQHQASLYNNGEKFRDERCVAMTQHVGSHRNIPDSVTLTPRYHLFSPLYKIPVAKCYCIFECRQRRRFQQRRARRAGENGQSDQVSLVRIKKKHASWVPCCCVVVVWRFLPKVSFFITKNSKSTRSRARERRRRCI